MIPIISIAGYSDAGKTTVVEKLVPELKKRGYRVGTIKHSEHESNFDTRGKDSWRHFAAGADAVLISSSDKTVMIRKQERRSDDSQSDDSRAQLAFLRTYLTDVDVVLAEGFKKAKIPKIEVFRKQMSDEPACLNDDNLVALVTDADIKISVPVFGLEESGRLAEFIVQKFLLSQEVSK